MGRGDRNTNSEIGKGGNGNAEFYGYIGVVQKKEISSSELREMGGGGSWIFRIGEGVNCPTFPPPPPSSPLFKMEQPYVMRLPGESGN